MIILNFNQRLNPRFVLVLERHRGGHHLLQRRITIVAFYRIENAKPRRQVLLTHLGYLRQRLTRSVIGQRFIEIGQQRANTPANGAELRF